MYLRPPILGALRLKREARRLAREAKKAPGRPRAEGEQDRGGSEPGEQDRKRDAEHDDRE